MKTGMLAFLVVLLVLIGLHQSYAATEVGIIDVSFANDVLWMKAQNGRLYVAADGDGFGVICYNSLTQTELWRSSIGTRPRGANQEVEDVPADIEESICENYVLMEAWGGKAIIVSIADGSIQETVEMNSAIKRIIPAVVDAVEGFIVITNDNISIIDLLTMSIVDSTPVPQGKFGSAEFLPTANRLFYAVYDTGELYSYTYDWSTTPIVSVNIAPVIYQMPWGIALYANETMLAICSSESGTIDQIDTDFQYYASTPWQGLENLKAADIVDAYLVLVSSWTPGYEGYRGSIVSVDTTTGQSCSNAYVNSSPRSMEVTNMSNKVLVIDEGYHVGSGDFTGGHLWTYDAQSGQIIDSQSLAGGRTRLAYCDIASLAFVNELDSEVIRVFAVP